MFLREEYRIVDFWGREKELDTLMKWAKNNNNALVSIAFITGGPGRGKSRLARELCLSINDRWRNVWIAGTPLVNTLEDSSRLMELTASSNPLLLVVEDGTVQWNWVRKLVKTALEARRKKPVRILLIARTAERWIPFFETEFSERRDNPFTEDRLTKIELKVVEGCQNEEGRKREFERSLDAFCKKLGNENVLRDNNIPDELLRARQVEILDIHMEALLVAFTDIHAESAQAGNYEIRAIKGLMGREQKIWGEAVKMDDLANRGIRETTIKNAIAWVATTDEIQNESDAVERLRLIPELKDSEELLLRRIARTIRSIYPSDREKWWGGVKPDRLTDWLAQDLPDSILEEPMSIANLPDESIANLFRHLIECAFRYQSHHTLIKVLRATVNQLSYRISQSRQGLELAVIREVLYLAEWTVDKGIEFQDVPMDDFALMARESLGQPLTKPERSPKLKGKREED